MNKELWFQTVFNVLKEHPDWTDVTVSAMQKGIIQVNSHLRGKMADIEMGFVSLLFKLPMKWFETKLNTNYLGIVVRAVKTLSAHGGTPFQKELLEKLEKVQTS